MNDARFQVSPPLSSAVRTRRGIINRALTHLESRGYTEVEVPLLAPYDELRAALGPEVSARLFRFIDRDGTMLVLRGDLTPVIARQLARVPHAGQELRVCYAARVARVRRAFAREQIESYELGVELVGATGHDADHELVALADALLETMGVPERELAVGDVRVVGGLLEASGLEGAARAELERAIARKDPAETLERGRALPAPLRSALARACAINPSRDDLDAIAAAGPPTTRVGADALRATVDGLAARGLGTPVVLDLGALDDRGYYTGIRFALRCPRAQVPLGRGGRYDRLLSHFGPHRPAVGVGFDVDAVLDLATPEGSGS